MKTSPAARPRSLQFEPLERREVMAAAITAGFNAGVLTVTGTAGNDTINFRQTGGRISVANVSGSWAAADVKSIVVNSLGGSDVVSLNSIANGGAQAMVEDVTVNGGVGSDRVKLTDGRDVLFSNQQFRVTVAGVATVAGKAVPTAAPPKPANWFEANIRDAALRTLGASLYQDGVIDRKDALALLRNVEDGNIVDASELADLRDIVANTKLFGTLEYVGKLTSYIVSANPANAKYLGGALGNLTVNSSSAQLEKLIGKWFLGNDRPLASGTYKQAGGQLFVNGASYEDIKQGSVGDCYFMASLAEVALKNPAAVTNMFIVNGDGTYTLRFYNGGQTAYVTVDSNLPTDGAGRFIYAGMGQLAASAGNELWTMLAEKGYVQLNEMGWQRAGLTGSGQNSYAAIAGGYCYAALGHITGQATVAFAQTSSAANFNVFVTAFNQGKMIEFASKSTPASNAVVGGHAYAVVGYNAQTQTITLFNPWGANYARVTMTWSQVQGSFAYFDRTA
ncbi:C2 family cysteine protease [Lacipirellula parvula]|uniref:Calpain catalytic domain-containing protein n=1 Tax=Lacipirellula parvula TaxID=2650471 RepID=A0A5K7X3M7_9BACT|nr:C2 family cysteine protease [Lacipirellula parvula]BBO30422.1 hypothetical protein PLANPX_0034 [Lacipirellula parvula]